MEITLQWKSSETQSIPRNVKSRKNAVFSVHLIASRKKSSEKEAKINKKNWRKKNGLAFHELENTAIVCAEQLDPAADAAAACFLLILGKKRATINGTVVLQTHASHSSIDFEHETNQTNVFQHRERVQQQKNHVKVFSILLFLFGFGFVSSCVLHYISSLSRNCAAFCSSEYFLPFSHHIFCLDSRRGEFASFILFLALLVRSSLHSIHLLSSSRYIVNLFCKFNWTRRLKETRNKLKVNETKEEIKMKPRWNRESETKFKEKPLRQQKKKQLKRLLAWEWGRKLCLDSNQKLRRTSRKLKGIAARYPRRYCIVFVLQIYSKPSSPSKTTTRRTFPASRANWFATSGRRNT